MMRILSMVVALTALGTFCVAQIPCDDACKFFNPINPVIPITSTSILSYALRMIITLASLCCQFVTCTDRSHNVEIIKF